MGAVKGETQCAKCGTMNPETNRFCGNCGAEIPRNQAVSAGEDGLYYCYRHKKETTRVTCGRCERPICTRCMVMGPVGPRCRDCARNRTPVRLRGLAHDAGSGLGRAANAVGSRPIWYLWIFQAILAFLRGIFRL